MKSIFSKTQLLATWLLVIIVITACAPSTPVPTSTPTSTSTPIPTSTFTPSPTPTETPQPTPTPRLVSVIQEAVLYSGPGKDGYEEIAPLAVGTNIEPLGIFVDFVLVRLYGADKPQEGYIPAVMLGDVPQDLPTLTDEQVPWKVYKSLATEDMPLELNHIKKGWDVSTLAKNLTFSGPFKIEINMQSEGNNSIILVSTRTGPNPWSASGPNKSFEFSYKQGALEICLNDNQDGCALVNNFPMSKNGGITSGEILIRFDQYGKQLEIFHEGESIYKIDTERFGDFPGGLFPDGKIISVKLAIGDTASIKVTKLIFYVPPDGKYK